jgi:hypothetical protein
MPTCHKTKWHLAAGKSTEDTKFFGLAPAQPRCPSCHPVVGLTESACKPIEPRGEILLVAPDLMLNATQLLGRGREGKEVSKERTRM